MEERMLLQYFIPPVYEAQENEGTPFISQQFWSGVYHRRLWAKSSTQIP